MERFMLRCWTEACSQQSRPPLRLRMGVESGASIFHLQAIAADCSAFIRRGSNCINFSALGVQHSRLELRQPAAGSQLQQRATGSARLVQLYSIRTTHTRSECGRREARHLTRARTRVSFASTNASRDGRLRTRLLHLTPSPSTGRRRTLRRGDESSPIYIVSVIAKFFLRHNLPSR